VKGNEAEGKAEWKAKGRGAIPRVFGQNPGY